MKGWDGRKWRGARRRGGRMGLVPGRQGLVITRAMQVASGVLDPCRAGGRKQLLRPQTRKNVFHMLLPTRLALRSFFDFAA